MLTVQKFNNIIMGKGKPDGVAVILAVTARLFYFLMRDIICEVIYD